MDGNSIKFWLQPGIGAGKLGKREKDGQRRKRMTKINSTSREGNIYHAGSEDISSYIWYP